MAACRDDPPAPIVRYSGYDSRSPENWPLIGPLPGIDVLFTICALSGFGTMTACAAGELLASCVDEAELPDDAACLSPGRYNDPRLLEALELQVSDGQL